MKSLFKPLIVLAVCINPLIGNAQTEESEWSYVDSQNNTIRIMDVSSLPKGLDTSFFLNFFSGKLISDTTKNMHINLYKIKRLKKGKYDVRLTMVPKDATALQVMESFGFRRYRLLQKKHEAVRFNYLSSDI